MDSSKSKADAAAPKKFCLPILKEVELLQATKSKHRLVCKRSRLRPMASDFSTAESQADYLVLVRCHIKTVIDSIDTEYSSWLEGVSLNCQKCSKKLSKPSKLSRERDVIVTVQMKGDAARICDKRWLWKKVSAL